MKNPEIGTMAWFQAEAWKSLHRGDDDMWDFSDSSLTYSPASVEAYGAIQEEETEYSRNVTQVEHELLKTTAVELAADLPDTFSYVDLGPGTEHKERYLFDELRKAGKAFEYFPVDISTEVLAESSRFATAEKVPVHPVCNQFEDIASTIDQLVPKPRFVSLGATFANYEPSVIVTMLLQLAGEGGSAMVTVQLRDRIDIAILKKVYADPGTLKTFEVKLGLLDVAPGDIECFDVTDDIAIRAKISNPSPRLTAIGMKSGDWVTVLKSYRHSFNQVKKIFENTQYNIQDTGKSFIVIHFKAES